MNKKNLVFSGVQPSGNLHLGNYLGAITNFVNLQKEMICIYCVVDLHAITVFQNPVELKNNILETTACFLAFGSAFFLDFCLSLERKKEKKKITKFQDRGYFPYCFLLSF